MNKDDKEYVDIMIDSLRQQLTEINYQLELDLMDINRTLHFQCRCIEIMDGGYAKRTQSFRHA